MLAIYGDESHDSQCERVFSVGALVAPHDDWEPLKSKWVERTRGVPFHAANCENDQGDFAPTRTEDADQKHKENQTLYKELTILLAVSGVRGFASNVDLVAQATYFPALADKPQETYYRCFWDVIEAMKNYAESVDDVAEFTFDTRLESDFNAAYLYAQLRECYPQWIPRLSSKISFETSIQNPRIQMGDLWVREAMKALDNDIGPVKRRRKSWDALKETGRFVAFSYSADWFRDFRADFENAMERVGFSSPEMRKWLQENRLNPNVTNYLRYLKPIMKRHPH